MARHLGDLKVEDLPVPFVAVTSDLSTGHEIWLQEGRLAETLRTAISLPGVFTPGAREGHWLVDGALVNPVPVSVCRALGADPRDRRHPERGSARQAQPRARPPVAATSPAGSSPTS